MAETKVTIQKEGKEALEVSERLYRVYYKGLGYKLAESDSSESVDDNKEPGNDGQKDDEVDELPAYDDITKPLVIERLKEKGIDHNPRDSKEVLYALLEGE